MAVPDEVLPTPLLETRSPGSADVSRLAELWEHEEGAVDMALEPGRDLPGWLSREQKKCSASFWPWR